MIFLYEDVEIYYEYYKNDKANSPPILFLHGWGGSTKSFELFRRKLLDNFNLIFLDFPPFGCSGKPRDEWTVKKYADMVERLLCLVKVDKVYIVAHSFGGRVALELASKNKNLILKMLLTGCAGLKKRSFKTRLKIAKYKFFKVLCKLKLKNSKSLETMGSEDYKNLTPEMKKTFNNIVNYDQKYLLKEIMCPVLLFWGKRDKATPFYFTKIFKKHIKDCGVVCVASGTHFAYLENPSLFFRVLESFFS